MRRPFGLPAALALLTTAAFAPAKDLPPVAYEEFASGFTSPLHMLPYREGEQAFVVVDQPGLISFLGAGGGKPGAPFLDLRGRMVQLKPGFDERGAIGLAFHPKFAENRKFYVCYSAPLRDGAPADFDHTGRLSEFKVREDGTADPDSERILLSVDQPQFNHDGGNIVFGADGYLYLGLGDGGAGNDLGVGHAEGGNGQALDTFLGKILRLDVDSAEPYGIPADNPFAENKKGLPEIFAWGIRNPWGLTTDAGGERDIIFADVGQNRFEEVNVLTKGGGNYGWPRYEAFASFDQKNPAEVVKLKASAAPRGFLTPVLAYSHHESFGETPAYGISITGGQVYRGKALPGLVGTYLFADWATSWAGPKYGLFAGRRDNGKWSMEVVPGAKSPEGGDQMVVGFASDHDGELYVLTNAGRGPSGNAGKIWKIVPAK